MHSKSIYVTFVVKIDKCKAEWILMDVLFLKGCKWTPFRIGI